MTLSSPSMTGKSTLLFFMLFILLLFYLNRNGKIAKVKSILFSTTSTPSSNTPTPQPTPVTSGGDITTVPNPLHGPIGMNTSDVYGNQISGDSLSDLTNLLSQIPEVQWPLAVKQYNMLNNPYTSGQEVYT